MKFLVFGLGSMGKRRVRCLHALGFTDITGFDLRKDRRDEAAGLSGIATVGDLESLDLSSFDAFIISTPPDQHNHYAQLAIRYAKPAFVEASVLLEDVKEIRGANHNNTFIAPSCTLRFHPMIKDITSIVKSGKYGKVTNFSYHSGQYLPDWHPWENVKDFYVSNRSTGGGREIVPFELTWIVDSIGWPMDVKGYFRKTIDMGANIEDSYAFLLKYETAIGSVVVDVASRYAVRNLLINMEKAQIQWKWDDGYFSVFESESNRWIRYSQPEIAAAAGYNKNIGEGMYIEELQSFIRGIADRKEYPNSLDDDIRILEILNRVETSDGGF